MLELKHSKSAVWKIVNGLKINFLKLSFNTVIIRNDYVSLLGVFKDSD